VSPLNEDFLFAQEAQRLGFVTEPQVEEGFLLQRRMAEELEIDERLAVILVKRGWLAEAQARRVHERIQPVGAKEQVPGYRLLEKIGHGAMGTVYRAVHENLQREVAIKILRRDLAEDATQIERIKEEARLLASLDHPNIVRALDAGESNGFPYVVMEYVEGETLKDKMAREGPLDEIDALKIARALADALERARRMGVVHRDVKPGNVIIAKSGAPKLMDLGLAKGPVDLGLTQHGATVGTPQYISPEQAQDPRRADTRSDIYSLGATLYAMVTGRPPFSGTTLAEVITKVLYREPAPVKALNRAISQETEYLIERMMLKDPSLRHRTPAEVVRDVDELLAGRSIVPPGFTGNWEGWLLRQRMRRWTRIAAISAATLLVLGLGVTWIVGAQRRAALLEEGNRAVAEALAATELVPQDDARTLAAKLAHAVDVESRWRDEETEGGDRLGQRVHALEAEVEAHRTFVGVEAAARESASAGAYEAAVAALEAFHQGLPAQSPVRRRVRDLVGNLRIESQQGVQRILDDVRRRSPASIEEMLTAMGAAREALRKGFIAGDGLARADGAVAEGLDVLGRVHQDVLAVERAFGPEALARYLAPDRLSLDRLRSDLVRQRRDTARDAVLAWRPLEAAGWVPASVVRGHVEARLDALEARVEDSVVQRWREAAAEARRLADAADHRGGQGLAERWRRAAVDGNLPEIRAEAAELLDRLKGLETDEQARSAAFLRGVEDSVLAHLRAGDVQGLAARLDAALQRLEEASPHRAELEDLRRRLPAALEALLTSALDGLLGRPGHRAEDVRLRDGTSERVWHVVRWDRQLHRLEVEVGRRREPKSVSLWAVHPQQLLAWYEEWAASHPGEPSGLPQAGALVRAVALLASPTLPPESDLRPARDFHVALDKALEEAGIGGTFRQRFRDEAVRWSTDQGDRERNASAAFGSARQHFHAARYESAFNQLNRLNDPEGALRLTDHYDQNRERIAALTADVEKELANRRLAVHLPGARITVAGSEPDARTTVRLDFQDLAQLQIPLEGSGILEPYARQDRPVTPGEIENLRLHLHRGKEGLVRGLPLVLPSVFDPAAPIVVSFNLYTASSPFFLGVDVDGLQVGVLSADPLSPAWRERWRLPDDLEPIREGDQPPKVSGYGRGRGVAFHAGAGFGDPSRWDWPAAGHGRNHESWDPDTRRKPLPANLFAFEPERFYDVRVVRERGKITLFVDDQEIASAEHTEWREVGATSDRDPTVRRGTSRIQILAWTPQAIDDLQMEGVVLEQWR
jgi:serine/threonine-protein kinase